jgi:hypothetical protein
MTPFECDAQPVSDPRFRPATDLISRTGAKRFELLHSDGPALDVWMAVARYHDGEDRSECAAAFEPMEAVFRLCERLLDRGHCTHCGKRTAFFDALRPAYDAVRATIDGHRCPYVFDGERKTFRRGCDPAVLESVCARPVDARSDLVECTSAGAANAR